MEVSANGISTHCFHNEKGRRATRLLASIVLALAGTSVLFRVYGVLLEIACFQRCVNHLISSKVTALVGTNAFHIY